jgi:hypothetical protein
MLPAPKLPPEDLTLHRLILELRHQVLAHTDLTVKQARVYLGRPGERANVCIASNSVPAFPHIDAVIDLIERTLVLLYAQRTQSEENLARTT